MNTNSGNARASKTGTVLSLSEEAKVTFVIVEGKNKGEKIQIEKGYCCALGRSIDDTERTKIFNVDASIALDDNSKKLVMQYLGQHFQQSNTSSGLAGGPAKTVDGQELLGGFVRGRDFQISDVAASRLHAMLFFDKSGAVGILDLVSKNGTYVNGAEVESKILKKNDLISIGSTKIRFES